jgi:hypothetical protein
VRRLNDNEVRVLFALVGNGVCSIGDLAVASWEDLHYEVAGHTVRRLTDARANSWVRNSLRGLVALGLAEQVGVGMYMATRLVEVVQAEQEHDEAAARLQALDVELAGLRGRLRTLTGRGGARDHAARRCAATWRAVVEARKAARR